MPSEKVIRINRAEVILKKYIVRSSTQWHRDIKQILTIRFREFQRMNELNIKKNLQDISFPLLSLFLITIVTIFIINRYFPKIGHDYGYHVPRMLDTYLHQNINGLKVQWYTPSFGGGLPAYPNPQDIQYSLPQVLMFIINPYWSLMLSLFVYSAVGFLSFYFLLKKICGINQYASVIGGSFILANGFYVEHAIVGHAGFQQFPLLGLILYVMFSKHMNSIPMGILIGITGALIVHQSGFYIIVIFLLSLTIMIPLISLLTPHVFDWKRLIRTSLIGASFALLLSISKLWAIFSFMRHFPREISDNYGKTYFQGLIGLALQVAGCFIVIPYYLLTRKNPNDIQDLFFKTTGGDFGIWESDISISPILLLLLIFGITKTIGSYQGIKSLNFSREKILALIFLLFGVWLTIDFTLAQGWLFSILKTVPIIKSLHINTRFAAAFIFPLSFIGAYVFDAYHKNSPTIAKRLSYCFIALSMAPIFFYLFFEPQVHLRSFNINSSMMIYSQIERKDKFPVTVIANVTDSDVFINNASNIEELIEPVFGYELESFSPNLQLGSIFRVSDGYYNMTNPASYVFPEENNLTPFERFRTDQLDDLILFTNRQQPQFNLSIAQRLANLINILTLVGVILYLSSVTYLHLATQIQAHFQQK